MPSPLLYQIVMSSNYINMVIFFLLAVTLLLLYHLYIGKIRINNIKHDINKYRIALSLEQQQLVSLKEINILNEAIRQLNEKRNELQSIELNSGTSIESRANQLIADIDQSIKDLEMVKNNRKSFIDETQKLKMNN